MGDGLEGGLPRDFPAPRARSRSPFPGRGSEVRARLPRGGGVSDTLRLRWQSAIMVLFSVGFELVSDSALRSGRDRPGVAPPNTYIPFRLRSALSIRRKHCLRRLVGDGPRHGPWH